MQKNLIEPVSGEKRDKEEGERLKRPSENKIK